MRELLGVAVSNAVRAAVPTIESFSRPYNKDKSKSGGGLHLCVVQCSAALVVALQR